MKNVTSLIFAIFLYSSSLAQTDLSETFSNLYKLKRFDQIINYIPKDGEVLTTNAYYFIAMSYYFTEDYASTIIYMDSAISKGPADNLMYYFKGMALSNMGKYKESLSSLDQAIENFADDPEYYAGKGTVFTKLQKLDSAIFYYEKAQNLPNCNAWIYSATGDLYYIKNNFIKALGNYELGLNKSQKTSIDYARILFNTALMNKFLGNIEKANEMFEELILYPTTSYDNIERRIQAYYSLGQIDKTKPYIDKLYEGYRKNSLPDYMDKMFCFDQFLWNGKKILAFESFEEPAAPIYVKHQFWIMNDKGSYNYRVVTETGEIVKSLKENAKYVLTLVKPKTISHYSQFVFSENYNYKDLKQTVIDILNNKFKPSFITPQTPPIQNKPKMKHTMPVKKLK